METVVFLSFPLAARLVSAKPPRVLQQDIVLQHCPADNEIDPNEQQGTNGAPPEWEGPKPGSFNSAGRGVQHVQSARDESGAYDAQAAWYGRAHAADHLVMPESGRTLSLSMSISALAGSGVMRLQDHNMYDCPDGSMPPLDTYLPHQYSTYITDEAKEEAMATDEILLDNFDDSLTGAMPFDDAQYAYKEHSPVSPQDSSQFLSALDGDSLRSEDLVDHYGERK